MGSVEQVQQDGDSQFVIRPNCSLGWRGAKRYLALQSAVVLLAAAPMVWMGGWPVLPFAGAELLALTGAFYWVLLRLNWIEMVAMEGDRIVVQRGRRGPEERVELPRAWARVVLEQGRVEMDKDHLYLRASGSQTEVGAALTNQEKARLGEDLTRALGRGQGLDRTGG
ncbi:DUF2244 domain-containing protein [Thiohalorhabdus sp.]|uniref:DUF2244 domain-containing protein n=1 Tax=Thiohalorhabdus sp. TaxID=3094134 RepID=UPI002FC37C10